ncbi:hypothetical protein B7P34_27285, partial [Streptosporangium nondiastaticum]
MLLTLPVVPAARVTLYARLPLCTGLAVRVGPALHAGLRRTRMGVLRLRLGRRLLRSVRRRSRSGRRGRRGCGRVR